jgi:hypothetical protein
MTSKTSPNGAGFVLILKPVLKPGRVYYSAKKLNHTQKRMLPMKNKLTLLALSAQKINRQHVQLIFVLVSLAMLVLGTSAPTDGGGVGR